MFRRNIAGQARLFVKHVLPAAVRPIHTLWHEIIGFIFLVMAIFIGGSGFRTWAQYSGAPSEFLKIALSVCFSIVLAGFGISSFRKARRISRS